MEGGVENRGARDAARRAVGDERDLLMECTREDENMVQ
jgi:hypothetical protein